MVENGKHARIVTLCAVTKRECTKLQQCETCLIGINGVVVSHEKMCPELTSAALIADKESGFDIVEEAHVPCVGRKCGKFALCNGNMSVVKR